MSIDLADMADFDPFSVDFRRDPHRFHASLVRTSPGFITMAGVKSAYVASFPQVTDVIRKFKAFSSLKPKAIPGMERIDYFNGLPTMNYCDPPEHTRRRRIVNPAFTPKRVDGLAVAAGEQIEAVFETALARGRLDGVGDLARPLAMDVLLTHFLQVDRQDHWIFINYLNALPSLDKVPPGGGKPEAFIQAWQDGAAYCQRQLDLSRTGKSDNLIGLVAASVGSGAIEENEMMAMMLILLLGGLSSLAGAISVSLYYLATHPGIAERIRRDPALAADHLDEALRIDTPTPIVMRFGADDAAIGGHPIPRNMPLYVLISSANHDPAIFPDPRRFDIDRPNLKSHIAFGQGMHTCIGATITRLIVELVLRTAVSRFRELRIADEPGAVEHDVSNARARHLSRLVLDVA